MFLSMLSSLQDLMYIHRITKMDKEKDFPHKTENIYIYIYRIMRNGSMGNFRITISSTHLNNRISVSVSKIEIVHTGILIKSYLGSYYELLIIDIDFFQLENVVQVPPHN